MTKATATAHIVAAFERLREFNQLVDAAERREVWDELESYWFVVHATLRLLTPDNCSFQMRHFGVGASN